ncbi:trimeric intracellular cation channel family protein [Fulvivirgaceae bacterium BMA10]|uniref:Trimeric intracellular cation channel family protein n=1 Tax=Splendidivirga corallicola TaxID=3051826 RepID=A0ABT8KLD9_9BACT|nr:trimeric intracellular cation channel family protein [Fulvivirgaceae bacterium BMA10]
MDLLYYLDLIGTFVFAISGTISAAEKKLDLFGASVIGFITAVGGGTVRDLLLDLHPITWLIDMYYIWAIVLGVLSTFLFRRYIVKLRRTLFIFDTIGIGVFTVLGIQKALLVDILPVFAIIMGMVSATVGGVIRDILCNEIPLIFRKEIYATACLAGGAIFFILNSFNLDLNLNYIISILVIIGIRTVSIKMRLSMPNIK